MEATTTFSEASCPPPVRAAAPRGRPLEGCGSGILRSVSLEFHRDAAACECRCIGQCTCDCDRCTWGG